MIFVVNGYPGSGKTTFENMVKEIIGDNFCKIISTIDIVKYIASICGWDGEKTPKNRKFLSDLKDLLTEWNDVPFKEAIKQVRLANEEWEYFNISLGRTMIFVDCREPREIRKLCDALNAKSIFISCGELHNNTFSNHADRNVLDYSYDIIIDNTKDLNWLKKEAERFCEIYREKGPQR